jgi:hypothetical protein
LHAEPVVFCRYITLRNLSLSRESLALFTRKRAPDGSDYYRGESGAYRCALTHAQGAARAVQSPGLPLYVWRACYCDTDLVPWLDCVAVESCAQLQYAALLSTAAADFMNNLDLVFKRCVFGARDCSGVLLTAEQQMSCVAVVWRAIMVSRWDKGNFDGNDDLAWLQAAAAVLEEMREELLAFGIQGRKQPPSSARRLGLLLSPVSLPLPLAGGGPALKISRSADEAQNMKAMLGNHLNRREHLCLHPLNPNNTLCSKILNLKPPQITSAHHPHRTRPVPCPAS